MLGWSRCSVFLVLNLLFFVLSPANGVPVLESRSEPVVSISVRASNDTLQGPVTVNTSNNIQTYVATKFGSGLWTQTLQQG